MAFEAVSHLFADRTVQLDSSDMQHGMEQFLQQELHSEKVRCRLRGGSNPRVDVRVGSTALAEAVLLREKDMRLYAQSQLQCSLGVIQVILDI